MLLAEELEVDLSAIRIEQAPTILTFIGVGDRR